MNCRQARKGFEELLDSEKTLRDFPELQAHLEQCSQCQAWYAQEGQVVHALEQMDRLPVPADFTKQVLRRLPAMVPQQRSGLAVWVESSRNRIRAAWEALVSSLARPARRRQWVPALVVMASLLLALGLLYGLQEGNVVSTPGAAVGASPWVIGGGAVLAVVVLVAGLFLWRRRK